MMSRRPSRPAFIQNQGAPLVCASCCSALSAPQGAGGCALSALLILDPVLDLQLDPVVDPVDDPLIHFRPNLARIFEKAYLRWVL